MPSHTPLGPEFQVNESTLGFDSVADVAIAADIQGGFVVAWTNETEGGYDVKARLFNHDGVPQTNDILVEAGVLGFVQGEEFEQAVSVDVAMTPAGDFVVVYDGDFGEGRVGVVAEYFTSAGNFIGERFVTPSDNSTYSRAYSPSVARNSDGTVLVTFILQTVNGAFLNVGVKRLTPDGQFIGGLDLVSTNTSTANTPPAIGADDAGNYVVSWNANVQNGSDFTPTILFQRYDASGAPQGTAITVDTADFDSIALVGKAAATGNFVIVWQVNQSGQEAVIAQRFDASGAAIGLRIEVNPGSLGNVHSANVTVGANDDFAVSWATGAATTVFARAFNADGSPNTPVLHVNQATSDFGHNDIAASFSLDPFIVTWTGFNSPQEIPNLVEARIFRETEVVVPPPLPPPPPDTDPATLIALVRSQKSQADSSESFILFFDAPTTTLLPFVLPPRVEETRLTLPISAVAGATDAPSLGEITGRVFVDVNGDGTQDPGEPPLAGHRVFLDINGNGVWDRDEPMCETDVEGRYAFSGLSPARYSVRQALKRARQVQTVPERNAPHVVELTRENLSFGDRNFGTKRVPVPTTPPEELEREPPSRTNEKNPKQE